ncbi:hypothetical protein B0H13DRAFT_2542397 [Mycena leptocephala]|nr:hypothetical protein B0H13DRAFT_2542397 [Mycena leptocephala]
MLRRFPDNQIFSQVVLGLFSSSRICPSSTVRALVRLIYATDGPSLVFGVVLVVGTLTPYPNWRCELLAFLTNLSLMFSAGMFFCIAINLPLVLAYNVNGQKMEPYYVFGTTLVCLLCNVVPYAAGKLGHGTSEFTLCHLKCRAGNGRWAVEGTCWYTGTDPREVLRWLIGTQTVWILLASLGEVGAFLIILGYLIVNELDTRAFRMDTQLGATHTSEASRRTGSNIPMFRNIILRIGLYPLVACLLNISTAVLDFQSEETKLSMPGFLADLAIYAGRPLIYVLLAATDPSFIRAIQAIRHPEFDLGTGPHHVWHSAQQAMPTGCLSTVIIDMPPDDVECEPVWSRKEAMRQQSQTATGTSTSGAEEWDTGTDRGHVGIAMNPMPTQPGSVIDIVSRI